MWRSGAVFSVGERSFDLWRAFTYIRIYIRHPRKGGEKTNIMHNWLVAELKALLIFKAKPKELWHMLNSLKTVFNRASKSFYEKSRLFIEYTWRRNASKIKSVFCAVKSESRPPVNSKKKLYSPVTMCVWKWAQWAHAVQFCCAPEESEECFYSAGHQVESLANAHNNWTQHPGMFKLDLVNRCAHDTRHLHKHMRTHICVDSGAEEYGGCRSFHALIEFRPGSAPYQSELLCVRRDCSQCRETEQTPTHVNTHTRNSLIIQNPRLTTKAGNNDELMPKSLSQFSYWWITLGACYRWPQTYTFPHTRARQTLEVVLCFLLSVCFLSHWLFSRTLHLLFPHKECINLQQAASIISVSLTEQKWRYTTKWACMCTCVCIEVCAQR